MGRTVQITEPWFSIQTLLRLEIFNAMFNRDFKYSMILKQEKQER